MAGSAEDDPWIAWLGGLSDDLAPLVLVWEYRIGRSGWDRFVGDVAYEGREGGRNTIEFLVVAVTILGECIA